MSGDKKTKVLRKLILALKEKCLDKDGVKSIVAAELPDITVEAVRKKAGRYLEELQGLGLVENKGDKFCWYTYYNQFQTVADYSSKLRHSHVLIPALNYFAGIPLGRSDQGEAYYYGKNSPEDTGIYMRSVEDHLRAHKAVWNVFDDYSSKRKVADDKLAAFTGRLSGKLHRRFNEENVVDPSLGTQSKLFVSKNLPMRIYSQIAHDVLVVVEDGRPHLWQLEVDGNEGIWNQGYLLGKGEHMVRKINGFLRQEAVSKENVDSVKGILEAENEASVAQGIFQTEIRKIILRINSGDPLLGTCEICPKFRIGSSS